MARGKYADRAAAKQARDDAQRSAAQTAHENKKLTQRVADLELELDQEKLRAIAAADEAARRIATCTSHRTDELTWSVNRLLETKKELEAANKKVRESHDKLFNATANHLVGEHSFTGADALQAIYSWLGGSGYIADPAGKSAEGFTATDMYRIDVARGLRTAKAGMLTDGSAAATGDEKRPW